MLSKSIYMKLQLNTLLRTTYRQYCQLNELIMASKYKYNGKIKKRNWEDRRSDRDSITDEKRQKIDPKDRVKRRKFAILLGYSGADYFGMQRNPQMHTIEEDLLNALLKTNLIDDNSFNQVQNIQFQRAARTDKGVSAARQLVSLKMPEKYDVLEINSHLPEVIRVFSVKRVTKGFNSKSNCDARTYTYMLPTFAFAPHQDEIDPQSYRLNGETLTKVNETLKMFYGTRNFHNFTSKKVFRDPSANRYIISFECLTPFVRKDVEFAVIQIKGQSFMMHQIRKMIGLTIAVMRGHTTAETITKSYSPDRLDIPMAPGLGLILECLHYDRYNTRYGSDHEKLEWDDVETNVNEFKENYIYPTIIDTEINEKSMDLWLKTLHYHTYDVRNEKSESNPQEDENDDDSDDDDDGVASSKSIG